MSGRSEEEIVVTAQRHWWDPLVDVLHGAEFTLGVAAGFVQNTIEGLGSVADYVIRDMGDSALYWIDEGIDALVPGDLPNPYRQSWVD